jgi:hypothetical protein
MKPTIAIQRQIAAIVISCLLLVALSSCGSQGASRLKADLPSAQSITVAFGAQTPSGTEILAATPLNFTAMSYCVLDATANCVDAQADLTLDRTAGSRIIFKLPSPVMVSPGIWMFTALNSDGTTVEQKVKISGATSTGNLNWRVVLMASDQGNQSSWINAFDNARKKLKEIFISKKVNAANFRELSLHPDQQSATIKPTSAANLAEALASFGPPTANDACLLHMTSHGSRDGFNVGFDRLAPAALDRALTQSCGDRPTVVLISACFSGLYVLDSSNLKKPNRIILTAARHDVTSFGCSPENEYTYWDSCLVENLPTATNWRDFATNMSACIERKEGGATQSFPQAFIGADVEKLALPQ